MTMSWRGPPAVVAGHGVTCCFTCCWTPSGRLSPSRLPRAAKPMSLESAVKESPAPFHPGAKGYAAHARFVRRVASSYRSDLVIAGLWAETAAAAAHAAATLPAEAKVGPPGDVLLNRDLHAPQAVEATVHHLDLSAGDDGLAGPSRPGLAVARETLDGVLGRPVPVGWDDVDYVLKATGRAELTDGDRASLGVLAARFPLLG